MLSEEDKQTLSKYVTSTTASVFALKNMAGLAGAAYARYSRAKGGFRETLLKEFLQDGTVDPQKAQELIERVLVAYGDDSVGELEGAHVSFERVTMLAAKEIEDRRIGGSPIEQSTRYVYYDQKTDDGNFLYYRGQDVLGAPYGKRYVETMDHIFTAYAELIEPLRSRLEQQKPITEAEYDINGDGEKEKFGSLTDEQQKKAFKQTYGFDLRAKACDILRSLLPVGALTNVGLFGNGRFYQNLLSHLLTTDVPEFHEIARGAKAALDEVIPKYVKRSSRSGYQAVVRAAMFALAKEMAGPGVTKPEQLPDVHLMDAGEHIVEKHVRHEGLPAHAALEEARDVATLAAMLYPYSHRSLTELRELVFRMDQPARERLVQTYVGTRATRRDRPGRALEDGYPYAFDLVTDFGVYKDLQRHRMNTQSRQLFTTELGFTVAPELKEVGAEERVLGCLEAASNLWKEMAEHDPIVAQYAVLHGHQVRWSMAFNDREAMHLLELRSTPQGHPGYRAVAQLMHKAIEARSAWRAGAMQFVDHNDYYWSRADSEAKQRVKEAELDKKYRKP